MKTEKERGKIDLYLRIKGRLSLQVVENVAGENPAKGMRNGYEKT
jgi:hypothetical protein